MTENRPKQCWWKRAAVLAACGVLFQTGACNQDLNGLAQGLTTTIANQYIGLYFADQFNASTSPF